MGDPGFWDFMIEGGDELLNGELCPKCAGVIYLDQAIEWVDEAKGIYVCPHCRVRVYSAGPLRI